MKSSRSPRFAHHRRLASAPLLATLSFLILSPAFADQTVDIQGNAGGKRFDGIGAVSGGGATSVLLKDYPEPQRSQILDLLFKPDFGAAMSALFVEVPGDGNSTQGSELSHMHTRGDENYSRGYEWWLMKEAKARDPYITLDGCAWSAPAWVGNGNFWSQDMADYYSKWIEGLKTTYGLDFDAVGCRNEKGVNEDFAKKLRATLDSYGLTKVKIHGFDNWDKSKWNWTRDMTTDPVLKKAVDIMSNHTIADSPATPEVMQMSIDYNKPIWNTEEHVYKHGFDCEISLVHAFNQNYIQSAVTKIVCWYLVSSVYPIEPYPDITVLVANSPWSGHYTVNPALWAYAHYGQFTRVGWKYLDGACGDLSGGGTYVTLASGADYSTIAETKGAAANQTITFTVGGGLSTGKVCVWRSNSGEQFTRQADLTPANGSFSITMEPNSIYTISTTSGQSKGSFADAPADKPFPFPYYETFDHYTNPKEWGYLPYYTADICDGFEVTDRPDGNGKCLRQVVAQKPQSWAPEWKPYTIIGDKNWKDYEVSADVYFDDGGWAGVMGRVSNVGTGYGTTPRAYYMRLDATGACSLYVVSQPRRNRGGPGVRVPSDVLLASGTAGNMDPKGWQNVKLRMAGSIITGFVNGTPILSATDSVCASGMAGLLTGDSNTRNTAMFDNLIINTVDGPKPQPTVFAQDAYPMYKPVVADGAARWNPAAVAAAHADDFESTSNTR